MHPAPISSNRFGIRKRFRHKPISFKTSDTQPQAWTLKTLHHLPVLSHLDFPLLYLLSHLNDERCFFLLLLFLSFPPCFLWKLGLWLSQLASLWAGACMSRHVHYICVYAHNRICLPCSSTGQRCLREGGWSHGNGTHHPGREDERLQYRLVQHQQSGEGRSV